MVSGIAIYNIQIVDLIKVVLRSIGGEDSRNTRVETTTQDRHQPLLLEAVVVCPLPAVLEMCLVLWLVVRRVEIVYATLQAGIHNRQILIRKSDINYNVGLERFHQRHKLRHTVGIDLRCLYAATTYGCCNLIALRLCAARQHNL